MRLVKLAIISFIFLFGIVTLISLLIPSHIRISKAIDLGSGGEDVLDLVADQEKWPLWHPAFEQGNDSARNKWMQETAWKKLVDTDTLVIIELEPKGQSPIVNG